MLGIGVVIVLGNLIWNSIKDKQAYCRANDCRSAEQRIVDEKDEEKAKEMCMEGYGEKASENIPERCKKILGV